MTEEVKGRTFQIGEKLDPDPEVLKGYEERVGDNEKARELFRQATALEIRDQNRLARALMNHANYLHELKLYEKMKPWPDWVRANYNLSSMEEDRDGSYTIYARPKDSPDWGMVVMKQVGDQVKIIEMWPPFKGTDWLRHFTIVERITKFFRRVMPS